MMNLRRLVPLRKTRFEVTLDLDQCGSATADLQTSRGAHIACLNTPPLLTPLDALTLYQCTPSGRIFCPLRNPALPTTEDSDGRGAKREPRVPGGRPLQVFGWGRRRQRPPQACPQRLDCVPAWRAAPRTACGSGRSPSIRLRSARTGGQTHGIRSARIWKRRSRRISTARSARLNALADCSRGAVYHEVSYGTSTARGDPEVDHHGDGGRARHVLPAADLAPDRRRPGGVLHRQRLPRSEELRRPADRVPDRDLPQVPRRPVVPRGGHLRRARQPGGPRRLPRRAARRAAWRSH